MSKLYFVMFSKKEGGIYKPVISSRFKAFILLNYLYFFAHDKSWNKDLIKAYGFCRSPNHHNGGLFLCEKTRKM